LWFAVDGVGFRARGRWFKVRVGLWAWVLELWTCVGDGLWFTCYDWIDGLRFVVHGRWLMVYGW